MADALRKLGAFVAALAFVIGLISVLGFLANLAGGEVSARTAIGAVLGVAAVVLVSRWVPVPSLLGGFSGLVYNYLPLFVLPLYATLERMDWRLVDAATDLGASQWAAFRQITLRLTAPGLITGTLLVFIPMMGEYVIPLVLGGGRVDLIGNVIQRSFLEAQDYALGSALALLVMGALSFFVAAYLYLSIHTEQEYDG